MNIITISGVPIDGYHDATVFLSSLRELSASEIWWISQPSMKLNYHVIPMIPFLPSPMPSMKRNKIYYRRTNSFSHTNPFSSCCCFTYMNN